MKTLLHICCANCAIYPVKVLREQGAEVTGYFFNHNIHPYQEFRRRLDAVHEYVGKVDLPSRKDEGGLAADAATAETATEAADTWRSPRGLATGWVTEPIPRRPSSRGAWRR